MHVQASVQGISRELDMGEALPCTLGSVDLRKMERLAGARTVEDSVRCKACGTQTTALPALPQFCKVMLLSASIM